MNRTSSAIFSNMAMDIPEGADSIRLPVNTKIKIFAITAAKNENDSIRPVAPLYDDFAGLEPINAQT